MRRPTADERELAELYAADGGLPVAVCGAFIVSGAEPPARERVDRVGYAAREVELIERYRACVKVPA